MRRGHSSRARVALAYFSRVLAKSEQLEGCEKAKQTPGHVYVVVVADASSISGRPADYFP
jgi:hypothetical protein